MAIAAVEVGMAVLLLLLVAQGVAVDAVCDAHKHGSR
jgi:hypothetical protein